MNGAGTELNPYIITSAADLISVSSNLSAYYQLGNDIDLTGITWIGIGSQQSPFTGHFDGRKCTISNLTVNANKTYSIGLFNYTSYAEIKNIRLVNASITQLATTQTRNGLLIGRCDFTAVSNCSVYGDLSNVVVASTISAYDGGICGVINGSSFDSCYFEGTVSSKKYFGGIGGFVNTGNQPCYVRNCVISATLTGHSYGSAIIPHNTGGNLYISNCIVYGSITGSSTISGITTSEQTTRNSTITNTVSMLDSISLSSAKRVNNTTAIVNTNCWANEEMLIGSVTVSSSDPTSQNGADLSKETASTRSFWENTIGLDFDTIWYWDISTNTPKLQSTIINIYHISQVSINPNPVDSGNTFLISVKIDEFTYNRWSMSTYLNMSGHTYNELSGID